MDFLHGDYLEQEYTEGRTATIIKNSPAIMRLLRKYGIDPDAVTDYHRYPIADNDSPRLSADRLEYTFGNLAGYRICSAARLQGYYDALCVTTAPDGAPELAFGDAAAAAGFAQDALKMSRIYVSDEDRYAMQRLSELLRRALEKGAVHADELYLTEEAVIAKLLADGELCSMWREYRALHELVTDPESAPDGAWRIIPAKKRYIDPLAAGAGRLSDIDPDFARAAAAFLAEPQDRPVCAR